MCEMNAQAEYGFKVKEIGTTGSKRFPQCELLQENNNTQWKTSDPSLLIQTLGVRELS